MNFTKQELEDIIVTALEGGSNYWYFLDDHSVRVIREFVPKEVDAYLSTAFAKAIDKGAIIPIYDIETSELLGNISKETIIERTNKLLDDNRNEVWGVKRGDFDAEDADIIFQYFLFAEVVFG